MDEKAFLKELKAYIEYSEVVIDRDFGTGRPLAELIKKNYMPEVYGEVLSRLYKIGEQQ